MKATLFVNGHRVGSLEYALPKDANGNVTALPPAGPNPGDVSVEIEADGGERKWFGMGELLDISP